MTMRKVKIIYNDDGCDTKYDWEGTELKLEDVEDTAKDVYSALKKEGFDATLLPLALSKGSAIEGILGDIRPEPGAMVFNLCERAFEKSSFEMNMAALLELYGVPFTGSPPLTLGLSLNKGLTKDILSSRGITTPEYCVLDSAPQKLKKTLKFPLIVKPLSEDASIGIDSGAVVNTMKALRKRVEYITTKFSQPAIVEEYVDGREFNVAVLGNNREARTLPASEIDFIEFPPDAPKICCYESKWVTVSPLYRKTKPVCPANIPEGLKEELSVVALKAYQAMGCRDYARVDMRVGEDGNVKVLEVNPNPDISSDAGFARAAKAVGMSYSGLIAEIIRIASERFSGSECQNKTDLQGI